jgi:serine/threonine protein kinase/WD40 repeat protein
MGDEPSTMKPASREQAVFAEALRHSTSSARAAYLAGACGPDTALRGRVEALLRAAENAGDFLEQLPAGLGGDADPTPVAGGLGEQPGSRIGRYKLLEQIGEGGCGVVYMAEQEEPVRRRVALKVIKLGMDTRSVVARFEAERQALALMDHPNIAKVFDGGATPTGRPYFVMELVRGVRITDFCDEARLSTGARLRLFVQVCQAIQHAHQKGIIHRDLKPSNILVTVNDGVPVPKVIDFGIAKATGQRLTEKTLFTHFHSFIGTPAYMSPEQAELSSVDIDTRSDIYSLGVLLYELLTGNPPFDGEKLLSAGLDEMRRIIRETEPQRPSTRLTSLVADDLRRRTPGSEIGAGTSEQGPTSSRRLPPTRDLIRAVQGDLDWIVMKCLEKDRSRRYDTANGLAADITRHLTNEPVIARPPSAAYKFQKACRRNKLVFSAVAVIAGVLMLGIIVSTWQAIRATQAERDQSRLRADADKARASEAGQRRKAESETERAEAQAYASDMNLAQQALALNNLGRASELLNRHRPGPQSETQDRRGWEWRYLWQQTQSDELFTLCQRPVGIFSLAVSPDARWLAVGEENNGHLTVWDIPSRKEILRLPEVEHPDVFQLRVAFSPTEPLLAYGAGSGFPPTNFVSRVRLWNLKTHRQVAELPLEFLCTALAFSPDGAQLVTSTVNSLTLWDVRTGARLKTYPGGSRQQLGTPVSITPDFRLVAQASWPGQVRVFDLTQEKERWNTNASNAGVDAVALSGDGRWLATANVGDQSIIKIWDALDGRLITNFPLAPGGVMQLLFGPDQRTLISAHTDQAIRVWDFSNPVSIPPPRILIGHPLEVWRLAVMPDGKTLISGGKDGSVRFWDLTRLPRQRGAVVLAGRPFVGWTFLEDKSDLLTCDDQGKITRWSGAEWQTTNLLAETGAEASKACFLPERQEVVIVGRDDVLRIFKWPDPGSPRILPTFPKKRMPIPFSWTLRRHGDRLAVGRFDQQVVYDYDVITGELKESWPAPGTLIALDFSGDGRYCVMGGHRGRVRVRNMVSGEESSFVEDLPRIEGVAFSSSGDRVGISTDQGFVRMWETGSWRDAGTLGGFLHGVAGFSFSPDGQRLAAGSSGEEAIRLFEMERHQPLISFRAEGVGFYPAFDPSGNVLAAMNAEGKVSVWRAPSWKDIEAAESEAAPKPRQP